MHLLIILLDLFVNFILPSEEYHCPACEARRLDIPIKCALVSQIFQTDIMNSAAGAEFKALALTLINSYGNGETENNWNEIASAARVLKNVLNLNQDIPKSDLEIVIDPLINVLLNTVKIPVAFLIIRFLCSVQVKEQDWYWIQLN